MEEKGEHLWGPMEFLSRSWSASALQVSKALAPSHHPSLLRKNSNGGGTITEDSAGEVEEPAPAPASTAFSFGSSATSQLVLEKIMSQSQSVEMLPVTSGRLSHSSGPLNGGLSGGSSTSESPPVSPSEIDDSKMCRTSMNMAKADYWATSGGGGGGKTVGRWLKDRREKKKEESRAQNAQLHAAVSVAGVAAAVAAITASGAGGKDDDPLSKLSTAVANAATLVAAQCVEAAESMGAERDHLSAVVSSAVNVRNAADIMTLTAAAATALRGAAILKARALKEVWNIAAVTPLEKTGMGGNGSRNFSGELAAEENFISFSNEDHLLSKGSELLKRTRKGALHWKIVCVYINRLGQVMLKMKSKHVAGTITKKKKSVVLDVCMDIPAWPGRHLVDGGEQKRYFGLKTGARGIVEFECKNQREYDIWTKGVSRLLRIVEERRR